MRHGSLFSGVGGFDLASEWMGWENVFHCEWNEFGQKVLKYYWPKAITYNDITKTDFSIHRGTIDILTGGFPCQPYSSAGKRLGKEDSRHLWPEMLRTIREIQPTWVVGENVRGLTNWNGGLVFDEVQTDLEAEGYQVTPFLLPACAVNAPHRRDRIWFVAYSASASEGAKELRQIRPENGEVSREGTQTVYDASRPNGIEGITTDSNLFRRDECIKQHEINTGKGGLDAFSNFNQSNVNGDATDSELQGLQGCTDSREVRSQEREMGREGNKLATQFTSIFDKPNATYSNGIGQECRKERECSERGTQPNDKQFKRRNKLPGADFKMFPSVSPICNGDDGFSDRLDGITFSKWRQESIKAGGNAIVPQVVYQIFKAIDKYNQLNNQLTL
jgi:DNA (cytosine-5)-methyltransferase 1